MLETAPFSTARGTVTNLKPRVGELEGRKELRALGFGVFRVSALGLLGFGAVTV